MKMNELYIEQTNQFCEANCKITAENIGSILYGNTPVLRRKNRTCRKNRHKNA